MHGTVDPSYTDPLFNQCEHRSLLFLPWHRAYLHFFERILRWAAQDPDLMLPFWDWTAHPVVPEPFRFPEDDSNPLFERKRQMNDGSALLLTTVVDDLNTALGQTGFPTAGKTGFSPDLESSPHGGIHDQVGGLGGLMSSVPTAAGDPIFWLHHANIDRLWDVWLNQGGGRSNPTDSAYLDRAYTLADETGGTAEVRVRDYISSAALGYRYEGVPNPPPVLQAAEGRQAAPRVVATSAPADNADAAVEKLEPKPLGFEEKRVRLNTVKATRPVFARVLPGGRPAGTGQGQVTVAVEGISADQSPGFVYRVYVNLPEGERREEVLRRYYVGSINFFGKTRADRKGGGHAHGAGGEFDARLDATRVVAGLQRAGRFDPDAVTVTILPATSSPPGADPTQVRARAEDAAKRSKVTYKRVSVQVVLAEE